MKANNLTMKINYIDSFRSLSKLIWFIFFSLYFFSTDLKAQVTPTTFDSSTTYTVPEGVTTIKVHVWGAGGAGGARNSSGGGAGGGGGAYSFIELTVTAGQKFWVNVGNGGSAGNSGQDSWVAPNDNPTSAQALVLAKGGAGVSTNATTGGAGGSSDDGIGTVKYSGGNGGNGGDGSTSNGAGGGSSAGNNSDGVAGNSNGTGGLAPTGGGNGGNGATSAFLGGAGGAGSQPGGGGGGARMILLFSYNGGSGGNGRVIIDASEYWGSGSRDLYPVDAKGGRATLVSHTTPNVAFPFPTRGTHYVYAEVGEQIAMASSTQRFGGNTSTRIRLYAPNGNEIPHGNANGNIPNRTAEIAGPRLPGQPAGNNRYTPIYYTVPPGGTGIYRVEFYAGSIDADARNTANMNIWATDNWTEVNNTNNIMAWDVSVAKQVSGTWKWQKGRTYTNVLNLDMYTLSSNTSFVINKGFYGNFKILTNDGFLYNVNTNGNNGIAFTFMANNKGFHVSNNPSQPSYKSIVTSGINDYTSITNRYHDPRIADNLHTATHKIFYSLPDSNMPESSVGAVHGGSTWLKPIESAIEIDEIAIVGVESTTGQVGKKGAYLIFDHEGGATYSIIISPNDGVQFPPRTISGTTVMGENKVLWDGKDGAGNELSAGFVGAKVEIKLKGAEVHFPFSDMEINPYGLILELLNNTWTGVRSDKVYWDDSDIPNVNVSTHGANSFPKNASHFDIPQGTSSNVNGHRWGQSGTSHTTSVTGTFGDLKGMDTWTFIEGSTRTAFFDLIVKRADLYTELSYSINGVNNKPKGNIGETVVFTVKAGNHGPTDLLSDIEVATFEFFVPNGINIDPTDINFSFNCSTEDASHHVPITYDASTRSFKSKLKLSEGCSVTYTFTGTINGIAGAMIAESTILRPNDVTDPDATNDNLTTQPTDPYYECYYNGLGGECNNIKEVSFMVLPECVDELIFFEDFGKGFSFINDGRKSWVNQPSISLNSNNELIKNSNGTIQRLGQQGGATLAYFFAPGQHDPLYTNALNGHPYVSRIANGYYTVVPPGYTQIGIPDDDPWHDGVWIPNAPTNSPDIFNSNYDWTQAWNATPPGIRDMSGNIRGNAFLIRGAASASQSIKPFFQFNVPGVIEQNAIYTLDLYSYVTYHNRDYLMVDVVDKNTGHIYATMPLKYPGTPPSPSLPTGVTFGWIDLTANFSFSNSDCEVVGKEIIIAIRGSQDRALETGKGFGHTLIDNIMFSKRIENCGTVDVAMIVCVEDCYGDINGTGFEWSYANNAAPQNPVQETINQPGSSGGFVLDIYKLDNSFNMIINGVPLHTEELEFESPNQNVRFKSDGLTWGNSGISTITQINSNAVISLSDRTNNPTPAIQVEIDDNGNVKLYGKRTTQGSLEELEVFNSNGDVVTLSQQFWYANSNNTIIITQKVKSATGMSGFGYGKIKRDCLTCEFLKEGVFEDDNNDGYAQVNETIKYTFSVVNLGDMKINDITIVDPLFGYSITLDENTHQPNPSFVTFTGDLNNNGILDIDETWNFTVNYQVSHSDIFTQKGVYNRARISGVGTISTTLINVLEDSFDPTPYTENDQGWNPLLPFHTFVPLKGKRMITTNPMIQQRVKKVE